MNTKPSDSAIAQAYRKRPVVVEVMGPLTSDNLKEITKWCGGYNSYIPLSVGIPTLEGVMITNPGDYVIRGVRGEFYPCKPDIFAATYEPVEIDAARPEQAQRKFQGVGHLEETGYIPPGSAAERADAELTADHARVLQDIPRPDEPGDGAEDVGAMADTIDQIRWSRYALNREQLPNDVKVALVKASRLLRRLAAKPQDDQNRKDAVETKYVRTAFAYSEAVDKLCAANVEVLSLKQDAERLDYIFECEIKAAREYIPVDAEQYKAKRRIKIDDAMAQEVGNGR